MRTSLRSRLERLEAQNKRARQSEINIAVIRRLPADFVGVRHIAHVERREPDTPNEVAYSYEERPGPGPPLKDDGGILIFIDEEDALL